MEKYYTLFIVLSVVLLLILGLFVFLNINEKRRDGEISLSLRFRTASYLCFIAVYAYYVYWLVNADVLRMMLAVILGPHAVIMLLLCLVSAKYAECWDNMPGGIRATLITFVAAHFAAPAFPTTEQSAYVIFRLFNDATAATIGLMIAVFMLVINIILMIAQLVMAFRAKKA